MDSYSNAAKCYLQQVTGASVPDTPTVVVVNVNLARDTNMIQVSVTDSMQAMTISSDKTMEAELRSEPTPPERLRGSSNLSTEMWNDTIQRQGIRNRFRQFDVMAK